MYFLLVAVLLLLTSRFTVAQGITGSITGTVTDSSGATVSGATVTVREVETNTVKSIITSDAGTYTALQLLPGHYDVEVKKSGFGNYAQTGILLAIDQTARINVQLALGSVSQNVEVTSTGPVIQTEDSSIGEVIDSQAIQNTPLNGRLSLMGLIALAPGVQGVGAQDQLATRGLTYAVGTGSRNSYGGVGVTLDGAVNAEVSLQRAEPEVPSLDAISQFKVLTSGTPAEFSQPSQMIVVSSSGTNRYSGELFEFNRSKGTSAKSYFGGALPRPAFERNEFGGNFTGPVRLPGYDGRDRSFFFFAYEGFQLVQSSTVNSQQPTVAQRAGYFTTPVNNPATGLPYPIATTGPYAGQYQVPASSFNSVDMKLLSLLYPLPTTTGTGTNTYELVPYTSHATRISLRVDQKLSEKDQLRGTFLRALYGPNPDTGKSSLQGGNSADGEINTMTIIGWSHTFSPTLLMDSYVSYLHLPVYRSAQNSGVDFSSIIPGLGPVNMEGAPAINITNITAVSEAPSKSLEQTDQFGTSITKVLARHTIKTGFTFLFDNFFNAACNTGTYSFNGQFTGNAFADFLIGDPSSTSKNLTNCPPERDLSSQYGAYVQDDWKPTSKLTINAGIRYDLQWFLPYTYTGTAIFEPSLAKIVVFGDSFAGANSNLLATIPTTLSTSVGLPSNPYSYIGRPKKNFAPRTGFEYQPFSNTVVRGAFGIYFQPFPSQYVGTFQNAAPFQGSQTYTQPAGTTPSFTMSAPFGVSGTFSGNPSGYAEHKLVTPYTEEYNLAIEHQTSNGFDFRLGYVGQHNLKQNNSSSKTSGSFPNINLANPPQVGVTAQGTRLFQPFSNIYLEMDPIFHSAMNSLQLGVHKQYGHGLTLNAEYQWTRVLGTESIQNASGASLQDSYGNIGGIAAQVLAVSYSYPLPVGKGKALLSNVGDFADKIIGGWQISGITNFQTGQPFSVSYSAPGSPVGQVSGRANRVAGASLYPSTKTIANWFNPAAFSAPPCYNTVQTGTASITCAQVLAAGNAAGVKTYDSYGNSAYDMLWGPRYQNWDMSLSKTITWHEHDSVQLRADTFNVFNHPNFGTPNASISNSNVGTITSINGEQREVEFAIKYKF